MMKHGKEYPATHSMDTSWFAIDEAGNVAVINFDENGPVPENAPSDVSIEEATFGNTLRIFDGEGTTALNEEQITDILSKTNLEFDIKDLWGYVFIKTSVMESSHVKQEFSELDDDFSDFCVVSEADYLFLLSIHRGTQEDFFRLVDEGIIVGVLPCEIEEDVFNISETAAKNLPMFFYQGGSDGKMERKNIPEHPFKESQLNDQQREKALRLPVCFDKEESFQIADYVSFESHAWTFETINGEKYESLWSKDEKPVFYPSNHAAPLSLDDLIRLIKEVKIKWIEFPGEISAKNIVTGEYCMPEFENGELIPPSDPNIKNIDKPWLSYEKSPKTEGYVVYPRGKEIISPDIVAETIKGRFLDERFIVN
ncbi:MAG: hypothetical protein IJJ72_07930 [Bacteroidales bacterium]|nr:hypothetical protein [Bacteroidales bacterium]